MAEKFQVVVRGGLVLAVHNFTDDLYDMYDHATDDWFDYDVPLSLVDTDSVTTSIPIEGVNGIEYIEQTVDVVVPKLDIPDPRLAMTLANAKLAVISMLRRITEHEILATYPVQKQMDINRLASPWGAPDKTAMETFIDGKYTTLTSKTAAVNALGSVSAVIAYDVWA